MTDQQLFAALTLAATWLILLTFVGRAILRPHRDPASRVAWVVVMAVLPFVGVLAYLLLGETNIGKRRVARMQAVLARLPAALATPGLQGPGWQARIPIHGPQIFAVAQSVNGFAPTGGNRGQLLPDSNASIAALVADIDAATRHVHLLFYIWLPDNNGLAVLRAIQRAAARGVTCRAIADGLGSRTLTGSSHWRALREAGVQLAIALPLGFPVLRTLVGRVDLRNHRKIVVIDNHITYCGSQNCADPEFRVKAKFAPWVDIMLRFEVPVARQAQYLFACDWMAYCDEDLADTHADDIGALLRLPLDLPEAGAGAGITAQVLGTGPTAPYSAMPEVFQTLMFAARQTLFITTPYYVPDEAIQSALCAAARRGVATRIIFPARNDSWVVGAASRSYYADLLDAGVRIFEYQGGLLHSKSLTLDGCVSLIGSANMDRRSFDLNYENCMVLHDETITAALLERQESYLARSREITRREVSGWPIHRRLWNNAIAMVGPVL